jgi:hypothetical protein
MVMFTHEDEAHCKRYKFKSSLTDKETEVRHCIQKPLHIARSPRHKEEKRSRAILPAHKTQNHNEDKSLKSK